jgi:peptide/nickel transport system permease protein
MTAPPGTLADIAGAPSPAGTVRRPAPTLYRALRRDHAAAFGLVLFGALIVIAVFAPILAPYDPTVVAPRDRLQGPSTAHWLGTDELGRDVLSRLIYGARASMAVGVVSVALAATTGIVLGLWGGFYGGGLDALLMRALDALLAFPAIILALAIVAALGPGLGNTMIAIGVVLIPAFARVTRSSVLALKEKEFVEAARAIGARDAYVMLRVLLPNSLSPLLVQISLGFAAAILAEAGLSFLGLGIQPPTPAWGLMLDTGRRYLDQTAWYSSSAGAAIFLAVLSLNLLGDGLRDIFDPRLRRGR